MTAKTEERHPAIERPFNTERRGGFPAVSSTATHPSSRFKLGAPQQHVIQERTD